MVKLLAIVGFVVIVQKIYQHWQRYLHYKAIAENQNKHDHDS